MHNAQLMSAEDWQGLAYYKDVLALHGMRLVLEAPVIAGERVLGTLNFPDRDAGLHATGSDLAVASALGRLVGSAVAALETRLELERERDHVVTALDLATEALVVTDLGTGRRRLNAAAKALLREVAPEEPNLWLEDAMAAARASAVDTHHGFSWTVSVGEDVHLSVRSVPGPPGSNASVAVLRAERGRSGEPVLPPSVAALLSPREQEVARLAVLGLQDDQIAARVFLSRYTVKQHLKSVYRKLGITSRMALARLVLDATGTPPSPEG